MDDLQMTSDLPSLHIRQHFFDFQTGYIYGFSIRTKMNLLQVGLTSKRCCLLWLLTFDRHDADRHACQRLHVFTSNGSASMQCIAIYGAVCKELGIAMR
jgi:hypothetical protein